MENKMKKITILMLSLIFVSTMIAQPRNHKTMYMPHKSFGAIGMAHPGPQGFGQPSARMEMMMTWKLTEELDLTPEQADKFFPRMKVHRENLENIDAELRDTSKDIRRKVEDGKEITDNDFNKMFEKATDLEMQKIDEKTRFMSELNGILDNTQRVKLTLFKTKFAKEMQDQIRIKRKSMAK